MCVCVCGRRSRNTEINAAHTHTHSTHTHTLTDGPQDRAEQPQHADLALREVETADEEEVPAAVGDPHRVEDLMCVCTCVFK